jgi:polyisoprenoid-binding protein YceI
MRLKTAVQSLGAMLVMAAVLPAAAAAQPTTYKVDPTHSSVGFSIRHFISDVPGRFKDFSGTVVYDAGTPAASSVQFSIKAASIATDNDARDNHLKSPDFFDAAKYPTLEFASTKVVSAGANQLSVTGNLTIKGVTKSITIPVKVGGVMKQGESQKAGFSTTFTINRQDYNVAWNKVVEGGGAMLGDDVEITIRIEANTPKPAAAK